MLSCTPHSGTNIPYLYSTALQYSPELGAMPGNQPLSAALHSGTGTGQVSNIHQIRSLAILFGLILIA